MPLEQVEAPDVRSAEYVLDLNHALNELAEVDARKSSALELRYFGGLQNGEIAQQLNISEATVLRELKRAEAWLRMRLPPPKSEKA